MGFNCGIVGLPNVGKSTLFNALTKSNKAKAANYPFATIEPNVGRVAVPDKRLQQLSKIGKSEKTIPNYYLHIFIWLQYYYADNKTLYTTPRQSPGVQDLSKRNYR